MHSCIHVAHTKRPTWTCGCSLVMRKWHLLIILRSMFYRIYRATVDSKRLNRSDARAGGGARTCPVRGSMAGTGWPLALAVGSPRARGSASGPGRRPGWTRGAVLRTL